MKTFAPSSLTLVLSLAIASLAFASGCAAQADGDEDVATTSEDLGAGEAAPTAAVCKSEGKVLSNGMCVTPPPANPYAAQIAKCEDTIVGGAAGVWNYQQNTCGLPITCKNGEHVVGTGNGGQNQCAPNAPAAPTVAGGLPDSTSGDLPNADPNSWSNALPGSITSYGGCQGATITDCP